MKKIKKVLLYAFLCIFCFTVPIAGVEAASKINAKTILKDALSRKQGSEDHVVVTLNMNKTIQNKKSNVKTYGRVSMQIKKNDYLYELHYKESGDDVNSEQNVIKQYESASNSFVCYTKEADNMFTCTKSNDDRSSDTKNTYKKSYKYMKDIKLVKKNASKDGQKAYLITAKFDCKKYLSDVGTKNDNFASLIRTLFSYSKGAQNLYAKVTAHINVKTGQLICMKIDMNDYVKKIEKYQLKKINNKKDDPSINIKSTNSYIMIETNPSKYDEITIPSDYKIISYDKDGRVASETVYKNKCQNMKTEYSDEGFINTYYDQQGSMNKKITTNYVDEFSTCSQYKDGELIDTTKIDRVDSITVSNTKQFLDAIGTYQVIYLQSGVYNLSDIKVKNDTWYNKHVYVNTTFDGHEFLFDHVDGLTLIGKGNVTIAIEPRYSNVLNFTNSKNITIKNLTVGHTKEKGECEGGVLNFNNTDNVTVHSCNLYGCGTYGITTQTVKGLEVIDTQIYECTYGIMILSDTDNAHFNNCTFRDIKGYNMIELYDCNSVTYEKCKMYNNFMESEYFEYFIETENSKKILFENCDIDNSNDKYRLCKDTTIVFKDCTIK